MQRNIKSKRQRKREAVQGVLFFAVLRIAAVVILLWSISLAQTPPWLQLLLGILALVMGLPVLFVGPTLKQRWKEIEGGEQDAAAQY